ncbi:MAG: universal stress protein [Magnetospirillum sp. WYHS-4]
MIAPKARLTLVAGDSPLPPTEPAPFHGRRILAVVDGRDGDPDVLCQARHLAKLATADLTVLVLAGRRLVGTREWQDKVRSIIDPLRAWGKREGLELLGMTLPGDPCRAILDCAREQSADLIVLAAPGPRRFSNVFKASLPDRLLRRAPCPILVMNRQ